MARRGSCYAGPRFGRDGDLIKSAPSLTSSKQNPLQCRGGRNSHDSDRGPWPHHDGGMTMPGFLPLPPVTRGACAAAGSAAVVSKLELESSNQRHFNDVPAATVTACENARESGSSCEFSHGHGAAACQHVLR